MLRTRSPFEVLEKVNENAYKGDLTGDYGISSTFNVTDLSSYWQDDYLADWRPKSSQKGEDDGGPSSQTNLDR